MKTLRERFWSKVEKTDACWVWIAAKQKGYGTILADGRLQRAHRISFEWAQGPIPDGMFVDHLCHNRACVRPDHLRLATPKQNNENSTHANLTSGHRGVTWDKRRGKWKVHLSHNNRTVNGGRFDDLTEAIDAADKLRAMYHSPIPEITARAS